MNLLDFEYLQNNLDTRSLYGSDSCIANLYLLQKKYNTWLKIHNNTLFRYYYGDESNHGYGFPLPFKNCHSFDSWLKNALDFILQDAFLTKRKVSFCFVTEEQKRLLDDCLSKNFNLHLSWETNRNDSDYIYLQSNLANLPGSIYQKKRNHISRFKRIYETNWVFKSFPENDIAQDILYVSKKWFEEKSDIENQNLIQEKHSIYRALENKDILNLKGGVLYVKDKPVAITIASPISDSVLDIIYEKAIGVYERNGAYAMINQQFAINNPSYKFFNREEDLGLSGLRKAKLSYKPDFLLTKFYGTIIN